MLPVATCAGVQGNPICINDDDSEPENAGLRAGSKRRRKYLRGEDPFNYFQHVRLARLRECKRLKRFSTPAPPYSKVSLATLQPPDVITLDDDEPLAVDQSVFVNSDRAKPRPVPVNWSDLAAPVNQTVSLPVLALPCSGRGLGSDEHPQPLPSTFVWASVHASPHRPPDWDQMASKPEKLVAGSPPFEFGASYQTPLQMDAASSGLQARESMQAMGDCEDSVDWKVRRQDALQFRVKHHDLLHLRDEKAGDASSSLEVESGTVCPPVPVDMDVAADSKRVKVSEKIKVSARAKVRALKKPRKEHDTGEVIPDSLDDSEASCINEEQTQEDEMRLAEKRKLEEMEAELWRAADFAIALSKPAVIGEEKKPEGCIHTFVRNPENGQSCEDCGMVKPAMSVEFSAPMRAAYKRAKREDRDCIDEDNAPNDVENAQPEPVEIPAEKLKIKIPPHYLPKMKPHQVQAFRFLVKSLDGRGGCILAHAPGTGKTFLMITFVKGLLTYYPGKKVLIVVPKGMLGTWKEEFMKWKVKDVKVYDLFDKDGDTKDVVEKRRSILQKWVDNKSVLLASYRVISDTILKNMENGLRKLLVETPDVVILDEGHVLRNDSTQVLQALRQLRTKSRVMLSGTIFQNNFNELYNMLKFVKSDFFMSDPDFAQSIKAMQKGRKDGKIEGNFFRDTFGEILVKQNDVKARASALQGIQKLRKLLSFVDCHEGDVLKTLPGLQEFVVKMRLLPLQAEIIRHIEALDLDGMSKDQFAQQIGIHPMIMTEQFKTNLRTDKFKALAEVFGSDDAILDPSRGAKTNFLFQVLNLCNKAGEKLIVFSNYTTALEAIQKMLIRCLNWNLGNEVLRIDGKSSVQDRSATIKKFNDHADESKVLLGSIKACGEGISLVGASRMVLLDPSWNPSVTCQAVSRAFRLGQSRKVYVYHLIADGTGEEMIRKAAIEKDWVCKNLVGANEVSDQEVQVDPRKSDDIFFQSSAVLRDVAAIYEVMRQH